MTGPAATPVTNYCRCRVTPPARLAAERLPDGVKAVSGVFALEETRSVRPVSQRVAAPTTFHSTSTLKAVGTALVA